MNKLWVRMSLTFAGVILLAVIMVTAAGAILARVDDEPERFTRRFLEQPDGLVSLLAHYYQTHQSWAGVEPMIIGAQSTYFRSDTFFLADEQQGIIASVQPDLVGRSITQINPKLVLPVEADSRLIGYFGLAPSPPGQPGDNRSSPFVRFLVEQLWLIATIGGVGGIIFGVIMSKTLTAPLSNLATAARSIGAHQLNWRVEEKGTDEIIEVARAFNEMAADLEQAEQLRRNLLADVAHELRNPLAILQGNLRAILDEVYPCNNTEMVRLYEHTRFLSRLVNDLHELAQAEARQLPLNRAETNLVELVNVTVDTFRPAAEAKGVILHTELPAGLPPLEVDAARITQVLQNLLANALRHTPDDGTITIRVQSKPEVMRLDISDTGEGIPPEHLAHIFDRFYRTDPARSRDRGGAGLGLAISRALVEAHGGQIGVTSPGISGQGTTFTIQLPWDSQSPDA